MKALALYGMILLAVTGTLSLALGLYVLAYPSLAMTSAGTHGMGGVVLVTTTRPRLDPSVMAWTNLMFGVVLLGMLAVMGKFPSPKLVKWNPVIMSLIGVIMLAAMFTMNVSNPLTLPLVALSGIMVVSGLVVTLRTNLFGKLRACPQCGARVVNWGRHGLTYCTSCSWYFGAIPESTAIMIAGDPGVGKTMLALKLAELSLSRGKRCVFVGCDQPPAATPKIVSEIHNSVSGISHAISSNAKEFTLVDAFSSTAKLKSDEPHHTTGVFDLNELSIMIAEVMKDAGRGLAVVVDSVNPLFLRSDATTVVKFLDHCRAKCIGRGDMFLFSITEGVIEKGMYRKLESMADVVIEMKFAEEHQRRLRRFRLTKIRGRNISDEWVYFDVIPTEGIVFRPIEKQAVPT